MLLRGWIYLEDQPRTCTSVSGENNHGDRFRRLRIGLWPLPNGLIIYKWLVNGGDPNHLRVLGWSSKNRTKSLNFSVSYCWWKKSFTTWDAAIKPCKWWDKLPTSTGYGEFQPLFQKRHFVGEKSHPFSKEIIGNFWVFWRYQDFSCIPVGNHRKKKTESKNFGTNLELPALKSMLSDFHVFDFLFKKI